MAILLRGENDWTSVFLDFLPSKRSIDDIREHWHGNLRERFERELVDGKSAVEPMLTLTSNRFHGTLGVCYSTAESDYICGVSGERYAIEATPKDLGSDSSAHLQLARLAAVKVLHITCAGCTGFFRLASLSLEYRLTWISSVASTTLLYRSVASCNDYRSSFSFSCSIAQLVRSTQSSSLPGQSDARSHEGSGDSSARKTESVVPLNNIRRPRATAAPTTAGCRGSSQVDSP